MPKLTGGCLCGAVRYKLPGAAQIEFSCHCRDCQYVSGGAPTHVIVMRSEDVTLTKGQPKEYWSTSAKGRRVARLFCAECGVPLFSKSEKHPQYLAVKVGSLDDPSGFRPQANTWTKSAQPWHHLDAAISRFKANPESGIAALLELARTSAVKLGRLIARKHPRPSKDAQEEG
jgi:hypothetical protein